MAKLHDASGVRWGMSATRVGLAVVAFLVTSCTGADLGDGGDDADLAIVQVDLAARREGAVTWLDGRPWLEPGPVAVDLGAAIVVRSPGETPGTHETQIVRAGAGELVMVATSVLEVARYAIPREIASDALVVSCDETTALEVARSLGDDVTVTLHPQHGYQLDGPNVVGRAARSSALRRVADVRFVRVDARASSGDAGPPPAFAPAVGVYDEAEGSLAFETRMTLIVSRVAVAPIDPERARRDPNDPSRDGTSGDAPAVGTHPLPSDGVPLAELEAADLVGHYRAGTRVLVLDAEGGYVLEGASSARARGRWRLVEGRVELDGFGADAPLHLVPNEDGSLDGAGVSAFRPTLEAP